MTTSSPFIPALVTPTPWDALKNFTDARIALGRAGVSLPTAAHLAFQLAHAQARDAVHLPFDAHGISTKLQSLGLPTMLLHSLATDRATYLQRPDLGRRLDAASLHTLAQWQATACNENNAHRNSGNDGGAHPCDDSPTRHATDAAFDLAFVVVDGLSALAIHQNAVPLVSNMLQRLHNDPTQAWSIAPLTVVEQGRVAIGDEVGAALNARIVVVLIGERPGLSSPDSMGLYLTWSPQVGRTDAQRNCISNVRPAGLSIEAATQTLYQLLTQMRLKQLSGVGLKDDMDHQSLGQTVSPKHADQETLLPWSRALTLTACGIHPLPKRGGVVNNTLIDHLCDSEGI